MSILASVGHWSLLLGLALSLYGMVACQNLSVADSPSEMAGRCAT